MGREVCGLGSEAQGLDREVCWFWGFRHLIGAFCRRISLQHLVSAGQCHLPQATPHRVFLWASSQQWTQAGRSPYGRSQWPLGDKRPGSRAWSVSLPPACQCPALPWSLLSPLGPRDSNGHTKKKFQIVNEQSPWGAAATYRLSDLLAPYPRHQWEWQCAILLGDSRASMRARG